MASMKHLLRYTLLAAFSLLLGAHAFAAERPVIKIGATASQTGESVPCRNSIHAEVVVDARFGITLIPSWDGNDTEAL